LVNVVAPCAGAEKPAKSNKADKTTEDFLNVLFMIGMLLRWISLNPQATPETPIGFI
jgi:hypothetical protein